MRTLESVAAVRSMSNRVFDGPKLSLGELAANANAIGLPLSILDLAEVNRGETPGQALAFSVTLAQAAERCGYDAVVAFARPGVLPLPAPHGTWRAPVPSVA